MRRFSDEEKETIVKLRNEGKSLNQICKILNRGKSAVYYQIQKNFGRSYKLVRLDRSNGNLIGEIMGLFASDGSSVPQSNYQINFHLDANEEIYAKKFMIVLNRVFNKVPFLFRRPKNNSIVVAYHSKLIYEFIREYLDWIGKKTYTVMLRELDHSKEFLIGFLRGYFDGDGHSRKDSRTAQFITTSGSMHHQVQEILSMFSLKFFARTYHDKRKNRHATYYIYLRDMEAVKFINLIQPRNSKRVKPWACSIAWSSKLKA